MTKQCILGNNKICDDCGECLVCDLDSSKICDNCSKCIDNSDYSGYLIEKIIIDKTNDKKSQNNSKN